VKTKLSTFNVIFDSGLTMSSQVKTALSTFNVIFDTGLAMSLTSKDRAKNTFNVIFDSCHHQRRQC
jgi:hypothetical protein